MNEVTAALILTLQNNFDDAGVAWLFRGILAGGSVSADAPGYASGVVFGLIDEQGRPVDKELLAAVTFEVSRRIEKDGGAG